jgi:hypothetical protein
MSQRAFKYFSIVAGGTPQPLVGTKLTAAVAPAPATGFQPAGSPDTPVSIPVSDSSMFLNGDRVILDVPSSGVEENVKVFSVPDSTHIQVSGIAHVHASGTYVRLAVLINSVYVQALDGNAGALYIGTQATMVKATGVFVIKKFQLVAASVEPNEFSSTRSGLANADDLGSLWIDGTTGDSYLPSIGQV